MNIRPIKNEADHAAALKAISKLMASDPLLDTPEGDRLDVLVTLVQAYEAKHHHIDPRDPVEAIKNFAWNNRTSLPCPVAPGRL